MKVSVIIPIYNANEDIQECVNSVFNQSYKDIEVICIDNNSTDNSWEIISSFLNDKRIRAYKQEINIGLYQNWNFAISKAFLGFLLPTSKSVLISVEPPCGLKKTFISFGISGNDSRMPVFALDLRLLL